MVEEEKIVQVIKLMNRVRSEYRGMSLSYEYNQDKTTNPTTYLIDMNITGKFPFPFMSRAMFEDLFWDFFYRDSKYFGIGKNNISGSVVLLNTIVFNGDDLDKTEVIVSNKFMEDFQSFYNEAYKESTLVVNLDGTHSPRKRMTIKLVDNKLNYEIENQGDIIYYIFSYQPTKIVLDGYPITTKTMQYYIDQTEPMFDIDDVDENNVHVDDIFRAINNLIYEESQDRAFTDDFIIFEKFYNLINNSGYEYNTPLTVNIGIFMSLFLRGFAGIDTVESGDYPDEYETQLVDNFLGFLEGQKGDYPL